MADGIFYPQVPTTPLAYSSSQQFLSQTGRGGLKTANVEPSLFALAEAGRIYSASTGVVADGVAPVQEIAEAGAFTGVALYNGNTAASTLSLVIISVGAFLCSGTPDVHSTLMGGVGQSAAALATTAGNTLKSTSGSARTTAATFKSSSTLATKQIGNAVLGCFETTATAKVGAGLVAHIPWGMFVVPATYSFAAYVFAGAGTSPLYGFTIVYAEIEAALV